MTRKQKRSVVIFGALAMLGIAAALVLTALSDQVTFFRTPTELLAAKGLFHDLLSESDEGPLATDTQWYR